MSPAIEPHSMPDQQPGTAGAVHVVAAGGLEWSLRTWGRGQPAARMVILLHGVTSSSRCWWRLGPSLAAAGHAVVALDMPGHGGTTPPPQRADPSAFGFPEAAALVADLVRALRLPGSPPAVVGHSWGAMVAAHLSAAGLRVDRLVLLDPPVCDEAWARASAAAVVRPASREQALAWARESMATAPCEDLEQKVDSLMHLDPETARAVFLGGRWDGALAALAAPDGPVAAGTPTWMIRGDPATGGFVPDEALPRYVDLLGAEKVRTVPGAAHSLERSHPQETLAVLMEALTS